MNPPAYTAGYSQQIAVPSNQYYHPNSSTFQPLTVTPWIEASYFEFTTKCGEAFQGLILTSERHTCLDFFKANSARQFVLMVDLIFSIQLDFVWDLFRI